MKILRFFVIYFTIFTIGALGLYQPAFSQGVTKSVSPEFNVEPGDEVEVTIRVDGNTIKIRNPADIMLVMDRTGSMLNPWFATTKILAAKAALKAFVDQTHEDGGLTDPGDYVGLVTYADTSPYNDCNPTTSNCASLDFPIANMTGIIDRTASPPICTGNKCAIEDDCGAWGCGIDNFNADGNTPIGAGMDIANKELLNLIDRPGSPPSSSRTGIRKYMVLATDGEQNTAPSPYQNNILQTAIANQISVFTVAIGSGVGFALLRDVACQTDTAALDPVNYCWVGSPIGNTPANPRNFFVANDPDALTDIYEAIADRIASNYSILILDQINLDVFQSNMHDLDGNPDQVDIVDCATGLAWPGVSEVYVAGYYVLAVMESIPGGKAVCIKFKVNVRDDPEFLDALGSGDVLPVDNPQAGSSSYTPWDPEDSCDTWAPFGELDFFEMMACIRKMAGRFTQIGNVSINVVNPAQPWLKTTGGDVGSIGRIGDIVRDLTDPAATGIYSPYNADYLVIARNGIDLKFRSVKNWLVGNPSPPGYDPLNIYPAPDPTIYDTLLKTYRRHCGPSTVDASDPNNIAGAASSCSILVHNGDLTISNDWAAVYSGDPAIIFVDGKMTIERDITIAANTGLIFVVKGHPATPDGIMIKSSVGRVDGIFVTDKVFNSNDSYGCGGTGSTNSPLRINGAVYAFGQPCFTRALANNLNNPAELINFEPKYLWLFKDIAGSAPTIYREVVP